MARRFISLMEMRSVLDFYLLCVPNGKEGWLVDLYLLCVPNGNEGVSRRFISIVCP